MTYAFDPELAPWVARIPAHDFANYEAIRAMEAEVLDRMPVYQPPVPVEIHDVTAPGPPGAPDVRVRVYSPSGHEGPLPGVLYIHGGAFIIGSARMFDAEATRIAAEVGAVVVSVDYRRAPEHPFPAPGEDCYAVLLWTAKSAGELGIDPDRLAICGMSAGGGLAATVTLLARDRGGPALCFQFLGVPELDDRLATPSMRAYHDTPNWNRPAAEISWDCYLGSGRRGTADVSPYAAPARAENLSGLPPAFVTACQYDPLRDEGIAYAGRLAHADVPTEFVLYPGTFHGCEVIQDAAITKRMAGDQAAALRRGLAR